MVLVCDRILENRTTTPRLVALSLCPSGQLFITSAHCWSRCQSAAAEDGTSVAGHLMRVPCVKESSKSAVLLTHGAGMMPAGTRDSPPSITKLISKLTSARHVHERTAQHLAHHVGADRSRSGRTHLRSCGAALASITVGLRCSTTSSEDIRTCRSIGSGGFAQPGRFLYIINMIRAANSRSRMLCR
jgi:hypothetical protein